MKTEWAGHVAQWEMVKVNKNLVGNS